MTRRLAMMLAAVAATVIATGCSGTYVNVPTLDGTVASQNPNLEVVRKVETEALRHVLNRYPPEGGSYAIELPDGTDAPTYWWILKNLPEGGEQLQRLEDDAEELPPLYRVEQVVIRGMIAQVEVVIPPGRYPDDRLVSVFLSPDIQGWYANRSRTWRIPADQALRKVREIHVETQETEQDVPPDPGALEEAEQQAVEEEDVEPLEDE